MMDGYRGGDPYLAFAKLVGLAPSDATKASHKAVRDRCKEVVLGVNYGIGAETMATKIGVSPSEARELIELHKRTYRRFWNWTQQMVDDALLTREMRTVFGWKRLVVSDDKATSLLNWHMQANGAEMMRLAAIAATEAGIQVCAPVHDAFLIAAPASEIDEHVAFMRELMSQAGEVVTGGLRIRTDVSIFRYPDRYMEERGVEMWNRIVDLLHVPEARFKGAVA
jgi:DNA polymerase I